MRLPRPADGRQGSARASPALDRQAPAHRGAGRLLGASPRRERDEHRRPAGAGRDFFRSAWRSRLKASPSTTIAIATTAAILIDTAALGALLLALSPTRYRKALRSSAPSQPRRAASECRSPRAPHTGRGDTARDVARGTCPSPTSPIAPSTS